MFYVKIISTGCAPSFFNKILKVEKIEEDTGRVHTEYKEWQNGAWEAMIFSPKDYEIVTKKDYDECWKEPEKMVEINGKKYSESTILEALKQYVN